MSEELESEQSDVGTPFKEVGRRSAVDDALHFAEGASHYAVDVWQVIVTEDMAEGRRHGVLEGVMQLAAMGSALHVAAEGSVS